MLIYCIAAALANMIAIALFHKSIQINALSVLPIVFIALMLFQAALFKKVKTENGFRTAYGSPFTAEEENGMTDFASTALHAAIPLMIPFIFFFPSAVKVLASFIIYALAFATGVFTYRIKNKDAIKGRFDNEETERREQEKKESMGEWK
ncbi:MAG: hypothetical protein E7659_04310 [Ruminococcaceae bacterium]|nr:hypothetical protein [Oscillospiraceae bacterium]